MAAAQLVHSHNSTTLRELEVGDLVEFKRGAYSHWAVFIGEEEVVHLAGDGDAGSKSVAGSQHSFSSCGKAFSKASVRRDNFWNVAKDSKAYKNNTKDAKLRPGKPEEIRKSALSKLGEVNFNIFTMNCEHFASWCRYQVEKSDQVDAFLMVLGIAGAVLVAAGLTWAMDKIGKERPK